MKTLVIDSSVFNKLFLDEPDSNDVVELFDKARLGQYRLIAPDLLYLEVISTANFFHVPISQVVELLEFQCRHLLSLRPLTSEELNKAVEITQIGHQNSGYPSIYDATFHAMALCNEAVFLTADKRHYAKTLQLGGVCLLGDL